MKDKTIRVLSNYDRIERALIKTYRKAYEYYSMCILFHSKYKTWQVAGRKYDSKIDPTDVIYLDPNTVSKRMKEDNLFNHSKFVSEVIGGDWSETVSEIEHSSSYQGFKNHFLFNEPWESTDFYQRVINTIKGGNRKWGCSSEIEFKQRCRELDMLYTSIKQDGYKSQRRLINSNDDPIKKRQHRFGPELQEVTVTIGKGGDIYFYDGRHRFYISRIAGVEQIPVRVKGRHKEWQLTRDRYLNQNMKKRNHPDLENLN